jgi:methanogenic corrinoid protein MtbC1
MDFKMESIIPDLQQQFLQSILAGKRMQAVAVINVGLVHEIPILDLYVYIIQESLYQVGKLWEENKISVAAEHLATAVTQFVLAQTYGHLKFPKQNKGNLILTGVQNELHQVGSNMVADVLESHGWNVHFLGSNLPSSSILDAIHNHHANVVGISTTMVFNIPQTKDLIRQIRQATTQNPPKIIVGGAAYRFDSYLWKKMGADYYASDVKETVLLLASM